MRDDLGTWIRRRLKKGVDGQRKAAEKVLAGCGVPVEVLQEQWNLQRQAQLSVCARKYALQGADIVYIKFNFL
jgi:hypothetical protein